MYYAIYFLSRPNPVLDMVVFPDLLEEVRGNAFGYWTGRYGAEEDSIIPICTPKVSQYLRHYKTIPGCHRSARKIMKKCGSPRIVDYRIAIVNDR